MWLDVHCACPVVGGSPVDCIGPGSCHDGEPVQVGDVCVDGEELLHLSPLLALCRKMLTAASRPGTALGKEVRVLVHPT